MILDAGSRARWVPGPELWSYKPMSDSTPSPSAVSAPTPEEPAAPAASADEGKVAAPRRRRRAWRIGLVSVLAVVLVLVLGVGALGLWLRHSLGSKIETIDDPFSAISTRAPQQSVGANQKPATNILVLGSDSRISAGDPSQWEAGAQRTDAIMIVQVSGDRQEVSVVSIPRDTWVEVPGYGQAKINAAYSYGGPELLVRTVEELSGLTVDHYVEVGMGGVQEMVDAVDGVEVCLDYDVDDPDSGLIWDTSQGTCQTVDGTKALAYSRMRKSDPTGDIGRGLRQRAVISAVVSKAMGVQTVVNFSRQNALVDAGTQALTIDRDSGTSSLFGMLMAFRSASSDGLTGAPPIESLDYEPGGIGAAVLLQDETAPDFFAKLREGELTTSDFNQT